MRSRRLLGLIALLACVAATPAARAEDAGDTGEQQPEPSWIPRPVRHLRFTDHPLVVQGRSGMGDIVGLVGVTTTYNLAERFSLGAIGLGLAYSTGPAAFGGRSGADVPDFSLRFPNETVFGRVHWAQAEILYETQTAYGFSMTGGIGYARALGSSGRTCPPVPDKCVNVRENLLTASVAVGFAP